MRSLGGRFSEAGGLLRLAGGPTSDVARQLAAKLGVFFPIGNSAIPFIGPGTANMGNNGALTALTNALTFTYANAYVWFTANQIFAGSTAGWYFTQFSSTSAGTVFNNTYTSGAVTIPASPTAFATTGPGSITGDTGEEFGPTITVPAGAMGPNGALRIWSLWSPFNSATTKTMRVRFSGTGGTAFFLNGATTSASFVDVRTICNRGVTGAQISGPGSFAFGGTSANDQNASIDTTAATTVVISLQRATATDNLVLESFLIEVLYRP